MTLKAAGTAVAEALMTDEAGLLAAIRDDPEDLPRLAHADLLEERGDVARARFVRVQLQRARLDEYDDRQAELQAEERRLLVAHGRSWLPPEVPLFAVGFRRGYVEVVETDLAGLRHMMPAIEGMPVRRLVLHPSDKDGGYLDWLRECRWLSRIESLALFSFRHTHTVCWGRTLLESPHLGRLRELEIGEENPGELLAVLSNTGLADRLESLHLCMGRPGRWEDMLALSWTRLKRLELVDGDGENIIAWQWLLGSELWRQLDEIDLHGVHSSSDDQSAMTEAVSRMTASRLLLRSYSGCDLNAVMADNPDWGSLRDLRMLGRFGTPSSLNRLLNHPGTARLVRLHLPDVVPLTQAGRCPPLPKLRWLECSAGDLFEFLHSADEPPQLVGLLCRSRQREPSLAWYLNSPAASRLRWLNVWSALSGAVAEALASSPHLGRLSTLRGYARDFSAGQARAIAQAPGLPCLSYADLESIPDDAAIELIRTLRIAWVGIGRSETEGELAQLLQHRYGEASWCWKWCLGEA